MSLKTELYKWDLGFFKLLTTSNASVSIPYEEEDQHPWPNQDLNPKPFASMTCREKCPRAGLDQPAITWPKEFLIVALTPMTSTMGKK